VENLAIERAKKLFKVPHVNVQPYSGSPANLAVYIAVCKPGDTVMGQSLPDGGHLTHGWKASATAMFYNPVQYHVKSDGYLDIEEIERMAIEHKPKLIWIGATAYVREFPFEQLGKIADRVGAYLAADTSHISGLIIAGAHKSPVEYAHIITTTTHKTLRGPRGAMIMVTAKGLKKDPDLAKKIDQAVFPGLQGGPHLHTIAGIAVSLRQAQGKPFKKYAIQTVKNAQTLAKYFIEKGLDVVSGGTDKHLVLIDLRKNNTNGWVVAWALEKAGIIVNRNTVPNESATPFYPSGLRMGTPALTVRGMKEKEMKIIGAWICKVIGEYSGISIPADKAERKKFIVDFYKKIGKDKLLKNINSQVKSLCSKFSTP
ncbi:MAG: Serine hydroxymethyltransferase, partial [Candidatus Woesebacteria bacterium GW2011_GWD1_38_10]